MPRPKPAPVATSPAATAKKPTPSPAAEDAGAVAETADIPTTPAQALEHNMQAVLHQLDRAHAEGLTEPVTHDLRVALRRCRSVAQIYRHMDPHPVWRRLNRQARALFTALGELRDTQVMLLWLHDLGLDPPDPVGVALSAQLAAREATLKQQATVALFRFDPLAWQKCARLAAKRLALHPHEDDAFAHLALVRLNQAHALHRRAVKNRSQTAWHALRIGVKRFRYLVENGLPDLHLRFAKTLKKMQDQLGEVHDLDVLLGALATLPGVSAADKKRCRALIVQARAKRLENYRKLTRGPDGAYGGLFKSLPWGDKPRRQAAMAFWQALGRSLGEEPDRIRRLSALLQILAGELAPHALQIFKQAPGEASPASFAHALGVLQPLQNKPWRSTNARRLLVALPELSLQLNEHDAALLALVLLNENLFLPDNTPSPATTISPTTPARPPLPQAVDFWRALLGLALLLENSNAAKTLIITSGEAGFHLQATLLKPQKTSLKKLHRHRVTLAKTLTKPVTFSLICPG